ncbi:4-hydroxyacetophenone monooxygenase [Mucor ambiguus]|uniref:4-hydroxyacetophenone monooxygenase n=1 Tax=Mucor ambiguus TaxID=91626 RepID=A0A0C9LRB4_9FUNG|nr:4-hydroxyacetophenone monooxygenase [Mucor ambiguus]
MKSKAQKTPSIAIIGSGISGICAFIQIQEQLGITAQVYEMNEDVGGTWLNNTYPNCRCDVTSHMYSYSFAPNPNWSQTFSSQAEILQYLKDVAQKHNMLPHIQFKTKVTNAVWQQDQKQWQLELVELTSNTTHIMQYDIIFSAIGTLRIPNIPSLYRKFTGPLMHTGGWDETIDLKGKRVALVGSGASAVQVIPHLAAESSQLISYQRTSPWVVPQILSTISDGTRLMFANYPILMLMYRYILFVLYDLLYILLGYPNSFLTRYFEKKVAAENRQTILELGRPDLVDEVLPTYPLGCKRGAFSTNYYHTLAQPHVRVITDHIVDIQDRHIITEDGTSVQVDVVVLATGFQTHDGMLGDISSKSLYPECYSELLTENQLLVRIPSLAIIRLYSWLKRKSSFQVAYAIRCIKELTLVEPKKSAQDDYMARIISNFQGTSWLLSCTSWYKNDKGEIINLYPSSATKFKWELSRFNKQDYMCLA